MQKDLKEKFATLSKLIGNTPLAKITLDYKGKIYHVYAKLEWYNFTGSIKDRMAFHILKRAYIKDLIKKDDMIIEATSGNTGIAFAAIGSFLGHKVKIIMPNWMSEERKKTIESFGAEIVQVSREQGGFLGSIALAKDYAAKGNAFLPLQFENEDNVRAHYQTTGPEIWRQMKKFDEAEDGFVAGVGSGGTVMGVGKYLKAKNPSCKVFPVEPANSPTITTGGKKIGSHRIQGISDEFIPPILNLKELDEIISVDDGDAIIMSQMLSKAFGIGVGISSGANLLAAIKVQELFKLTNVVTIFSDDNKKYLSTDYIKNEIPKTNYMTSHIKLITFEVVK